MIISGGRKNFGLVGFGRLCVVARAGRGTIIIISRFQLTTQTHISITIDFTHPSGDGRDRVEEEESHLYTEHERKTQKVETLKLSILDTHL